MASAMLSHRPPKARRPHLSSGSASLLPRFPTSSSTNLTSERPPQASTSVSACASRPLSSHTTTDLMDESLLDFDQLLVQSSHASHPGEGAPTTLMMMSSNLFDEGSSMLNDAQMSFLHHDEEITMVVREREDNNMDPDDTRQVPEADTREQRHVEEREATSQGATANRVAPVEAAPAEASEEHTAPQPQPWGTASQESPIDTRLLDRSLPTNRRRSSISPILKRNAVVPLPALNENEVTAQPARASTKSKPSTSASSTSALPSNLATTAASVRPMKPAHILPKDHPSHPRVIEATLIPIPRARERSRSRPTSSEPTLSRPSEAKAEAERKFSPLVSTQRSSTSVSSIMKSALPLPPLAPPPPPHPPLPRSLPIGDYLAPLAEVSDEEAQSPQSEDRLESFETTLPTPNRASPPPACLLKVVKEQREDSMNQDGEEDLFELEMDVEGGNDDRYDALDADGSLPRIGESLKDFERHNRGNDRTAKTGRRMTTSTPAKAGVLSGVGRRVSVVAAAGAARSAGLRKMVPEVLEQEKEQDGGMMRPILPERYGVQSPFGSQSVTAVKEVKPSSTDRPLPPPPNAPLPPPVASSSLAPRDPSLPQKRRASRAFEVGNHHPAVTASRPQAQEPIPATTTASRRASTAILHPWPKASTSTKVSTRTPVPSIPTTRATEVAPPKTTLRLNYTYTRDPPTAQSVLTTIRLFDPCGPIHEEAEGQQGLAPPEIERPRLPAKIGDLTVPMENTFGARAEERERLRKERKARMALGLGAELGERVRGGVRGGVKRGSSAMGGERGNKRSKLDTGASSVDGGVLGTNSRQNLPSTTSAAATAPFKSTSTSTSTQPKPFTFTSLNRQRPAPSKSIAIHNPSSLQAQSEVALALNKASNLDRLGWSERQKLREEEVRRRKEMARKEEEEAERRKLKALKESLLQAKAPAVGSGGATSGMRRCSAMPNGR